MPTNIYLRWDECLCGGGLQPRKGCSAALLFIRVSFFSPLWFGIFSSCLTSFGLLMFPSPVSWIVTIFAIVCSHSLLWISSDHLRGTRSLCHLPSQLVRISGSDISECSPSATPWFCDMVSSNNALNPQDEYSWDIAFISYKESREKNIVSSKLCDISSQPDTREHSYFNSGPARYYLQSLVPGRDAMRWPSSVTRFHALTSRVSGQDWWKESSRGCCDSTTFRVSNCIVSTSSSSSTCFPFLFNV